MTPRHCREVGNPIYKPFFKSRLKTWIPAFAGMTVLCMSLRADDAVLLLPGEAKGAALGEAYSASASGADALWYNPAGLSRTDVRTLTAMHTIYLENISFSTLGAALPFGTQNAVGVGVSYLTAGSIPSYDNTGTAASAYTPTDIVGRVGIAKTFYGTSAGLMAFYMNSKIADSAGTYGINAGLHQVIGPVSLALVGENYGGKLKYQQVEQPLPSRVKFGGSARLFPWFMWNADIVKPKEGGMYVGTGAQFRVINSDTFDMALRTGFNTRSRGDVEGLHGLSAGAGFGFSGSAINYAWIPLGDLGQTHRISLDIQLGEPDFNPYSERELRSKTFMKPGPAFAPRVIVNGKTIKASSMPSLPWKKMRAGPRTSKDRMIDLLARDALCSDTGARALVTRTRGVVAMKAATEEKKWVRAWPGKYLFEGDTIKTNVGAVAHVMFANGVRAEVGANTSLKVKTSDSICDKAATALVEGDIYAVAENGKDLRVETPLGEAYIKDAQAKITYDGTMVLMRVQIGSGSFTADGITVPIQERTTFVKTNDGKSEKKRNDPRLESATVEVAGANPRTTPGRWDPGFAKSFEREMMRLDSMPGIKLAEYVRDTTIRDQLKVKVSDMQGRRKELETQKADFFKDVQDFKALRETLRKSMDASNTAGLKGVTLDFKQANRALANAQQSLKGIEKELKVFLKQLRSNQEFLATVPIVRMLNITAQESTIPFATGRAVVPEEAQAILDSVAESIKELRPSRVVIEGHTDKTGSIGANKKLSKQRAEAVSRYMRNKTGLPMRMFTTKGVGADRPIENDDTPEAMAKNRRVEIWLELRGL